MKRRSAIEVMLRLSVLVKPLFIVMIIAIITGVLGFLASIFITVLGGFGILSIMDNFTYISFNNILIITIVIAISRGILHYIEQICNHYLAFKILAIIRDKVFNALRTLAPAKLECKDKGNLISVITSDIELLEVFYAHTLSPVCIAFLVSTIMTIFIGSFHIVLGIIAAVAYICVGVIIPIIMSKKTSNVGALRRSEIGNLNTYILDSLRGIKEIIQYDCGKKRIEELNKKSEDMANTQEKMKGYLGLNTRATGFVISFFSLSVLIASSILLSMNHLQFNGVIICTIAMFSSFGPVIALANLGSGLTETIASGNRVLDILDDTPKVDEVKGKNELEFKGVCVDNINFSYEENKILEELSLSISKGEVVGIKGKSGSGKSTLIKLMMRFWDVDKGKINISGINIKNINTENLRSMESYVTQETYLFKDSIKNNIKIANLEATDIEVIDACKKASIHNFIESLPNKYDTQLEELGDNLSGGERQRIGIARAFLNNAPLMILDEPTSNVDSLNESIILKAISKDKGRTTILTSHRESTMKIADRVYSVENGRMC